MSNEVSMEKVVALAKGRGFVYPGSEIYGGLQGTILSVDDAMLQVEATNYKPHSAAQNFMNVLKGLPTEVKSQFF